MLSVLKNRTYRHLFTELATALGTPHELPDQAEADPMAAMLAGLTRRTAAAGWAPR